MFSCRSGAIPFVTASAKIPSMRYLASSLVHLGPTILVENQYPCKYLKSFEKVTVIIGVEKAKERKDVRKRVPKSDIRISFSWFDFIMGDIQVPVISLSIRFIKV